MMIVMSFSLSAKTRVAITVDDLPAHGILPSNITRVDLVRQMLTHLNQEAVPKVYGFINAGNINHDQALQEVITLWTALGHPLANHTFTHKSINDISIEAFKTEILLNDEYLKNYKGDFDWKFFRYPYLREGDNLERRNSIRDYLKKEHYQIAQVTIDFEDWSWNNPYTRCLIKKDKKQIQWLKKTYLKNAVDMLHRAEKISQAIFQRPIPHILLLHIGSLDAELMGELVRLYKKEGVEFITLTEAMKDEVYKIDPGVWGKWGAEFTHQIMKQRGIKLEDIEMTPYQDYPQEQLNKVCN